MYFFPCGRSGSPDKGRGCQGLAQHLARSGGDVDARCAGGGEVYDENSKEEEQGVVACPWTEQAEAAELEAAANISHDFVDEDPIVEQPDDDHLDEQADANEEVPQILFDRVNPVAVEEIGKRVLSKVFRTGNGNGPTVMRICGDILAQCTRGKVAGARCFRTTYREEKGMVAIGKKGRRFSGGSEEEEEGRGGRGGV